MPRRRQAPPAPPRLIDPERHRPPKCTLSDSEPPPPSDERRREVERICGLMPGSIELEQTRQQLAEAAHQRRIQAARKADVDKRREWFEWSLSKYGNGNK